MEFTSGPSGGRWSVRHCSCRVGGVDAPLSQLPTHVQGEAFGCPYKTASPQELTEQLRAMRLPPRVVEEAVSKARGHHYQLACTAVFQGQHNCICESGISHPNQV